MDNKWTLDDMPDLSGKVVIVTGGNSGLGFESVKVFSEAGAKVFLTCRDTSKGEKAKAKIGEVKGEIVVKELDLSSFVSIEKFCVGFSSENDRLDILLNNAGIMTTPYFLTSDGLEAQSGVNHFGHFALTGRLFELISKTPGSRVVNVSSSAHKMGKMDFDNYFFTEGNGYSRLKSYGRSKLANLLFTYEMQRRLDKAGIDCKAVAAHPGVAETNLGRYLENTLFYKVFHFLFGRMFQSPEMGALPQIRASVDPEIKGGEFFGPGGFNEIKGYPIIVSSSKASHNQEDATKLWDLSVKTTKVQFL